MNLFYHAITDVGCCRENNEDAFLIKRIWNDSYLLVVVVDGVGGENGGEYAADLACRCIDKVMSDVQPKGDVGDLLKSAVIYANNEIIAQQVIPNLHHMSCVLSAVLVNIETGYMNVAHVGDTRVYFSTQDKLLRITHDDSVVGPKEESGQLSEEEAQKHPRRNVITRYLGETILHWDTNYIQTYKLDLEVHSSLLLCSDGLYDMILSSKIKEILDSNFSVEKKVDSLICEAKKAGGKDNITVIVVDIT